MSNSFSGINIGLSGLRAQQKSLDVTAHNIANANNDGYSRQRAVHTAGKPHPAPGMNMPGSAGQVGSGVDITEIERIRDDFIDEQIRLENQELGKWEKVNEGYKRIESIFNEPSDNSLNQGLDNFWQSLQDLSNNPEDSAVRSTVQQRGLTLVDTYNSLSNQLTDYRKSLNEDTRSIVNEINSLSNRIADLNKQISQVDSSGNQANDLLDKRNELFSNLNELVNVRGFIDNDNNLNINLGGVNLVSKNRVEELDIKETEGNNLYQDKVIFSTTGHNADIKGGQLAGILETRDQVITNYLNQLDQIAFKMGERFNNIHSQGYDVDGDQGQDFFDIVENIEGTAGEIDLSEAVKDSINRIAAGNFSSNPEVINASPVEIHEYNNYELNISKLENEENGTNGPDFEYVLQEINTGEVFEGEASRGEIIDLSEISGVDFDDIFKFEIKQKGKTEINFKAKLGNGNNSTALAKSLKDNEVINGSSVMGAYESLISGLGVEGQRSEQMVDNQKVVLNQLKNQQESISGVSLDEEMANMIKYQHAYSAAARIISNTDQMLESLMQIIR